MIFSEAILMTISGWKRKIVKDVKALVTAYAASIINSLLRTINFTERLDRSISAFSESFHILIDLRLKHVITSGITAYEIYNVVLKFISVAQKFFEIWINQRTTVNISEN